MRPSLNRSVALVVLMAVTGCARTHPQATQPMASNQKLTAPPSTPVVILNPSTVTQPVATSDLGTVGVIPGLAPKPKPFIAVPKELQGASGRPSTLLLEHASPDSPVPLSDFSNQPVYTVNAFKLRYGLSADEVKRLMGKPAQIAGTDDPWLVYRLVGEREIWLHFVGESQDHLDAADVIRGAEDGYVRDRVFAANDK